MSGVGAIEPGAGRARVRAAHRYALLAGAAILGIVAWRLGLAAAALALVGAGAALIGWRFQPLLPFFALLVVPAGSFTPTVAGVNAPLLEIALPAAGTGYAISLLAARRLPELGPADAAMLALVVAVLVSALGPADAVWWLHRAAFWAGLGLVFHASVRALADEGALRRFVTLLAAVVAFEGIWAIVEYAVETPGRHTVLGGAVVSARSAGTILHPNSLGFFLALCLPPLLALALGERGRRRVLVASSLLLGATALAVTFSRAAWIALLAGCLVLGLAGRARRVLLLAGGAAALAALGLGATNAIFRDRFLSLRSLDTIDPSGFRIELWRRAARLVGDHPLTGAGSFFEEAIYGGRLLAAVHPHNLWLGLAVHFGVLAAVAFSVLLLLGIGTTWRSWRGAPRPESRLLALGLLAALVVLAVGGVFNYPFWNEPLATLVVLLLAAAVASEWLNRPAAGSGRGSRRGSSPGP